MLNIIYNLERKTNPCPLFLVVFIIDLAYHLSISWIVSEYNPAILEIFEEKTPLTEIFILSVIFGPVIETFLFQYLIIEFLFYFKKINFNIIIFISAFAFSLIHNYNLTYILVTFIGGLIYASYYVYLKIKKIKHPFIYIWAIHTLYNFFVFILGDVLDL